MFASFLSSDCFVGIISEGDDEEGPGLSWSIRSFARRALVERGADEEEDDDNEDDDEDTEEAAAKG